MVKLYLFDGMFFILQKVKKAILDQMVAEGKKEQLKSFEQVRGNFYPRSRRAKER